MKNQEFKQEVLKQIDFDSLKEKAEQLIEELYELNKIKEMDHECVAHAILMKLQLDARPIGYEGQAKSSMILNYIK